MVSHRSSFRTEGLGATATVAPVIDLNHKDGHPLFYIDNGFKGMAG